MAKFYLPIILYLYLSTKICLAQGEAALPFLLISPFTEANGMGEVSVSYYTNDPLAHITNPAHLGMISQKKYFSFGHNYSKWFPGFQIPDQWIRTYGFSTGINLKKTFGITPEISLGLAYSRVHFNFGHFNNIGGYESISPSTSENYDLSDQYTFGIGINYWVEASAGITFKSILSKLLVNPEFQQGQDVTAKVNAYDFGLLINLPLVAVFSKLQGQSMPILPSLFPFFDFSFGLAKNNLGNEKVFYQDSAQADPLPRYARVGIGLNFGIEYNKKEEMCWQLLSFKWAIEANDLLVSRYSQVAHSKNHIPSSMNYWKYKSGLGDINFFDEVILGKTNPETIKKKGWEFNFLEFIYIRGGRFEEDINKGNRRFNTSGYGVSLAGINKFLRAIGVEFSSKTVLGFILNHVDIRYNHSDLLTDEDHHPLSNTTWKSLNILISN